MRWMCVLLFMPTLSFAAVYKCEGLNGNVEFSDKPCGGAISSEAAIVNTPPPRQAERRRAASDLDQEEIEKFYYVDVPAYERQAAELMASTDPKKKELGRQLAWKAHQGRVAFMELERSRKSRAEIEKRYSDALRQLNNQ